MTAWRASIIGAAGIVSNNYFPSRRNKEIVDLLHDIR